MGVVVICIGCIDVEVGLWFVDVYGVLVFFMYSSFDYFFFVL